MIETVGCDSDVRVTITGPIGHLCPYRDETDHGTIDITWTVAGQTLELHSLAAYLRGWADARLAHEQLTDLIRHDLATMPGITRVTVSTAWQTAGMRVHVSTGELDGCST
jgi:NADPH-dependent 7-cyano-7-deazaguanine reductase QueF